MNELEQNNQNATAKITYDTLLAAAIFFKINQKYIEKSLHNSKVCIIFTSSNNNKTYDNENF